MLPENATVEVEPARARRLLLKLLAKIADLEDEAPSSNGAQKRQGLQRPKVFGSSMPPAHPFGHLLLKQQSRSLRFTYKRRRCQSAGSDSNTCEPKRPHRSASLESLSDSEAALGQDPALWLTTPRKRHRRGSSASARSLDADGSATMETRSQSFSSRVEHLVVPADPSTNRFKATYLLSHIVGLGETLWLGGATDDPKFRSRVLPLKVAAAFRLGEAIARSDGSDDFAYLDEMYALLPPMLVRFVLWQHAVTMCYLRIPAYADTLSDALWQVGAFAQQQWLVLARLSDLSLSRSLLSPASIAPLHLRAIDIGIEHRFISDMLLHLAAWTTPESSQDSLWMQFASTEADIAADSECAPDNDGCAVPTKPNTAVASNTDIQTPSRYVKWVARISSTTQSIRIVAAALVQALAVLSPLSPCSSRFPAALEAVKRICAIVLTKLCSAATIPASDYRDLTTCVWSCLLSFAAVTGIGPVPVAPNNTLQRSKLDGWQDIVRTCAVLQTQMALLILRQTQLHAAASPPAFGETPRLIAMAKQLVTWLCSDKQSASRQNKQLAAPGDKENHVARISRRGALVACFDSLLEKVRKTESEPTSLFSTRILENIVLPLATAGASPVLLCDIARVSADVLGKRKAARSIVKLTLLRIDAIWTRHHECSAWHQDWNQLQAVQATEFSVSDPTSEDRVDAVRLQLEQLLARLEQNQSVTKTTKTKTAKHASNVPEDELGMLLSRYRRKSKRV
ncbi:hypothetical protein GGF43_002672 [Coemansia sp. RSA 2618]|nr:hypothetical protein GGF43_002672 [Coemansia sp. RSA 2618]